MVLNAKEPEPVVPLDSKGVRGLDSLWGGVKEAIVGYEETIII